MARERSRWVRPSPFETLTDSQQRRKSRAAGAGSSTGRDKNSSRSFSLLFAMIGSRSGSPAGSGSVAPGAAGMAGKARGAIDVTADAEVDADAKAAAATKTGAPRTAMTQRAASSWATRAGDLVATDASPRVSANTPRTPRIRSDEGRPPEPSRDRLTLWRFAHRGNPPAQPVRQWPQYESWRNAVTRSVPRVEVLVDHWRDESQGDLACPVAGIAVERRTQESRPPGRGRLSILVREGVRRAAGPGPRAPGPEPQERRQPGRPEREPRRGSARPRWPLPRPRSPPPAGRMQPAARASSDPARS